MVGIYVICFIAFPLTVFINVEKHIQLKFFRQAGCQYN